MNNACLLLSLLHFIKGIRSTGGGSYPFLYTSSEIYLSNCLLASDLRARHSGVICMSSLAMFFSPNALQPSPFTRACDRHHAGCINLSTTKEQLLKCIYYLTLFLLFHASKYNNTFDRVHCKIMIYLSDIKKKNTVT